MLAYRPDCGLQYSCGSFLLYNRFLRRICFGRMFAVSDCLGASNTRTDIIVPSSIRTRDPSSQISLHGAESRSAAELREVAFVILTTVTIRSTVFWDVTQCRLAEVEQQLFLPPDSCLVYSRTP
jgi:hypothetical protein